MGTISTLEEFLNEIRRSDQDQGKYAFRGQADATWGLHSAATRRLIEAKRIQLTGTKRLSSDRLLYIYNIYHKDELIDPARRAGFDVEEGSKVSDLQLLGKLQHFGAATGLIDFTWNPLVALWFACEDHPEQNGKVFVVNLDAVGRYQRVSNGQKDIDDLFPTNAYRVPPLYWEPEVRSEASARILRQQSVFVLPRSQVLEEGKEGVQGIEIESSAKEKIRKELADLGVDELSLFLDIHGFSRANGPKSPVRQMNDPFVYRHNGNQFYQQGDYKAAVDSYTRGIVAVEEADVRAKVRELYYLRGNAKAANKDYEGAIEDYNSAEEATIADLHVYLMSKREDVTGYDLGFDRPWILLNRGNVKAALERYEDAIQDYDKAIQFARKIHVESATGMIFFNRANAKTILGNLGNLKKYEEAIHDYIEAMCLAITGVDKNNARFNKGNVLVMSGRFSEACQCYDESVRGGDSKAASNRKSLEDVLQSMGGAKYDIDTKRAPDGVVSVVVTVNVGSNVNSRIPRDFSFIGNVGSTGNVSGAYNVGEMFTSVPDGKGYPEYPPFRVEVKAGNPPPQPGPTPT